MIGSVETGESEESEVIHVSGRSEWVVPPTETKD